VIRHGNGSAGLPRATGHRWAVAGSSWINSGMTVVVCPSSCVGNVGLSGLTRGQLAAF
jgi:hypothetical protein